MEQLKFKDIEPLPFEDMGTVCLYSCTLNSHKENQEELRQMIHTLDFYDSYKITKEIYRKQLETEVYSIFRIKLHVMDIIDTLATYVRISIDMHSKEDRTLLENISREGMSKCIGDIQQYYYAVREMHSDLNIPYYKLLAPKDFGEIQFERDIE